MGAGVSGWPLAQAVARLGQLGVVSGTALAIILVRRLQLGDPGGPMRRALRQFPFPPVAERVLDQYYIPGGKPPHQPFTLQPMPGVSLSAALIELTVLANFVEVFLAKEGHDGLIGVNYLEKLQFPTLPSIYGAMLAGVDYMLMGAGVPRAIPGILDQLARGEAVHLRIDVSDLPPGEQVVQEFDPRACFGSGHGLKRPLFLAIVSSATLAMTLARKSSGKVDGFIVEGPSAGGHNAPPRGPMHRNERGEPIYTDRDLPDMERIRALGLPFWMAGSFAEPAQLAEALKMGAVGVQVGTPFAFCEESGLDPHLKRRVIEQVLSGNIEVLTDPLASPTGFPFKVVQLDGTLSEAATYERRERGCDLGYLRSAYRKPDGAIGYRCPAEPLQQYLRKGGQAADTCGRKCLCNGLLAAIGLGQTQTNGYLEKPLLTAGESVRHIARFLRQDRRPYTAADVVQHLVEGLADIMNRMNGVAAAFLR
ncbi:MAG: nitronate monooxygenase [Planctomycetota bacterium]|nr:nitronate monooxygenase [Planctomycetota bacterium]